MQKWWRLGVVVALLVAAVQVLATDPYGYAKEFNDNIRCWVQISIGGVEADGDKISGTNVLLVNSAGANTDVGGPSSPTWEDTQFYRIVVKMNGETVADESYDIEVGGESFGGGGGGGGPVGGEYEQQFQPFDLRFASNHFAHGDDVTIEVKCYFAMIADDEWVEDTVVTATIEPSVYNRVAMWKTQYDPWDTLGRAQKQAIFQA